MAAKAITDKKNTRTTKKKVVAKKVDSVRKTVASSSVDMPAAPKFNRNWFVIIVFLLLLGAFLYFSKSLFIVAMVNGRPISRLSLINQLERTAGQSALESLINRSLIEQEALKENISVSDADIQSELESVQKDLEGQGMTLDAALSAQGMNMSDFKENLRMKQTVEQLLKDDIKVSDEEVRKYFEDNSSLFGEDAKFEDLESSIREQLESQRLSEEFQTWYNKLKEESDIKYFVNF